VRVVAVLEFSTWFHPPGCWRCFSACAINAFVNTLFGAVVGIAFLAGAGVSGRRW
jgi:predicted metal-binding protein